MLARPKRGNELECGNEAVLGAERPEALEEHWGAEVHRLESAQRGSVVVIPLNPQGWTVTLVAR